MPPADVPARLGEARDFLSLPGEVRNIVYEYYIYDLDTSNNDLHFCLPFEFRACGDYDKNTHREIRLPGLALTNRLVSAEFLSLMLSGSTFRQLYAWEVAKDPKPEDIERARRIALRPPTRPRLEATKDHQTNMNGLLHALHVKIDCKIWEPGRSAAYTDHNAAIKDIIESMEVAISSSKHKKGSQESPTLIIDLHELFNVDYRIINQASTDYFLRKMLQTTTEVLK